MIKLTFEFSVEQTKHQIYKMQFCELIQEKFLNIFIFVILYR
jgi:hypothetical protein